MLKKIRNSLSSKIFLWVFCSLTVCCIIVYGIIFALLPKQFDIRLYDEMQQSVSQLSDKLGKGTYYDAQNDIEDFCRINNASVILSGEGETRTFGEINTENESRSVIGSTITAFVWFTDKETEYTLTVYYLSRSASVVTTVMLKLLPAVAAGILLLSALSAFICSRVIVSPIKKLSESSKRMTEPDADWECETHRSDEIGVLSDSFNTMASRLRQTMDELKAANEHLKEDIKRSKLLEQQRRDFFIAVSHELKTPLTVLKGRLENMMIGCGDYKDHDKYLPLAYDSAEEIEKLIMEIITITKTENMDISSSLCEVSLTDTIEETVRSIEPLAKEKNIVIHQQISRDTVLTVDKDLWSKALSNIIGNAVRHSPEGEQVFIALETVDDKQALVVTNTGASIPEEDMPHLFTPFYRADRSRSRATGGSGLGLYIVKTILELHDMSCSIKNTENGVAFYVFV